MNANKLPLSVALISQNEEINLDRTLKAIADIASEIIIVDAHSQDATLDIAAKYSAKVFIEDWKGFVKQKNSALEKCTYEWILFIDCDEVISPELKSEIAHAIFANANYSYMLKFRVFYLGKILRHTWKSAPKLRLVRKSHKPKWVGDTVHEQIKITGNTKTLKGFIIHYSYNNIIHQIQKMIRYAELASQSKYYNNKTISIFKLILNPASNFIKLYILNLGFLDGTRGFVAAAISSYGTFLKYLLLYEQNKIKNI